MYMSVCYSGFAPPSFFFKITASRNGNCVLQDNSPPVCTLLPWHNTGHRDGLAPFQSLFPYSDQCTARKTFSHRSSTRNDHIRHRPRILHPPFEARRQRCSYTRRLSSTIGRTKDIALRRSYASYTRVCFNLGPIARKEVRHIWYIRTGSKPRRRIVDATTRRLIQRGSPPTKGAVCDDIVSAKRHD